MASILNLSPRLEAIVNLCPKSKVVADIGCDHGLVTAELVLEDIAKHVIATEKSEQCLNKAILFVDSINISPFVSFRHGDGFNAITKYDKINLAIIAGMGGDEIIKILERKPKRLYNFILQPMKDAPLLREYLSQHGFKIVVDKLIKENDKFYDLLQVTKGRDKLADLEIAFGKTNFSENYEVFYDYLIKRKQKLEDFKNQVGELGYNLQTEYENVLQALSLFDSEQ